MNRCQRLIVTPFLSVLLGSTLPAFAATVVVGTCMPGKVSYDAITDAVEGAPAGSTIELCPGVYPEQVVISKSLTLKGITVGNSGYPVITPPATGLAVNAFGLNTPLFWAAGQSMAAQILVQGGANVTLSDLALDASPPPSTLCFIPFALVVGVLVQDASATLNEISVKNQLKLCGAGAGVLIQNDSTSATAITVRNSTFVNASPGFEADGASITSTVADNSFLGSPSNNYNAISIGRGNSTIESNEISDFNYPGAGTSVGVAAFGIYLSCTPGGTVSGNVVANTQVGIWVDAGCGSQAVSITNNTISNAPFIGIYAGSTNGVVQGNHIRSTMTAIRLPAGASNLVENNVVNDACAAYGYDPTAGTTTLTGNTIFNAVNVSLVNTTGLCP